MLAPSVYGYQGPFTGQQCPPINPCCCDAWTIAPGETVPLQLSFADRLADSPGFRVNSILSAELTSLNDGPPGTPADPGELAIVSGYEVDPSNAQPGFTRITGPDLVWLMLDCAPTTAIGRAYRLDLCVRIRDCEGTGGKLCKCVFINVQQC